MNSRRRIAKLVWLIGLAITLLACALLWRHTATASSAATVVYLGIDTESTDVAYRKVALALKRWERAGSRPYQLRYQVIVHPEQVAQAVEEALSVQPTLVLAPTGEAAAAVARGRSDGQVVFVSHLDPVRHSIVPGLRHPGPGITGISLADNLHAKRLELLRDAYPGIRTVGVLADRSWWRDFSEDEQLRLQAPALGLRLRVVLADTEAELEAAMHDPAAQEPDAWYVPATYLSYVAEAAILQHLQRLGRPSMHTTLGEVERGAPLAYVQDTSFVFDAMADLTHRVLRGVDAGSIPVQGPRQFVLAVRPRETPAALRLHPSIVRRADRVY